MSYSLYPSVLYLQDGTLFRGWSFFDLSSHIGEIVFNTGMTGYQEIFSDPSYSGQMVVFTYPEIGNTGLNKQDNESNFVHIKAFIARNISCNSSSWRSKYSLKKYIIHKRIPHIFGLDTRSLTKRLRLSGVMNSLLCSYNLFHQLPNLTSKNLNDLDIMSKITVTKEYHYTTTDYQETNSNLLRYCYDNNCHMQPNVHTFKIVVLDFGLKFNILRNLLILGCDIVVLPANSNYEDIKQYRPDGIVLSNGPGNPALANCVIHTIKKLIHFSKIPIFGICMGHQVLNIAFSASTFKLKFGHRGLNHPTGFKNYSEITSQNHGFAVEDDSSSITMPSDSLIVNYFNLNDLTIASTLHKLVPIFSVQYHPESSPGPHDSEYLFRVFIQLMNLINLDKQSFLQNK